MIKRTVVTAMAGVFAAGFFSAPALAAHCPKDVKAIDAALKTAKVSGAQMSAVKELRDRGAAQHKSGQHGAAIESLHEAMNMLGIAH